ncbi:uncharacterized protein [Typha latifolia]|uniref:uncharacterized protein isoform X2 n=1 Tax=Typha latifolia TaxID=4733 RepID=UPI003C2F3B75
MEFRVRDYEAEESACALQRSPATDHPLTPFPSSSPQAIFDSKKVDRSTTDPLGAHITHLSESAHDRQHFPGPLERRLSSEADHVSKKEWALFRSSLGQKFLYSNTISISPISNIIAGSSKDYKSLAVMHMDELEDEEMIVKEEKKVITQKEYVLRLQELKGEIVQAWRADDRIKALKLSIKVARLLLDSSVLQFYPTLFMLVVDVMDMLGDLVWERIKRKSEYDDNGTLMYSVPDNFVSADICSEAKETCYNWFCKIGSVRELLPRIYLELAILRCWRFLEDDFSCILHRLTMMIRGVADPLASAYCHLYVARSARILHPEDAGYLITSLNDITMHLERVIMDREAINHRAYKDKRVLISLIEPPIEWIMKCVFASNSQGYCDLLKDFGLWRNLSKSTRNVACLSVVLHYLLKQLPAEVLSISILDIMELLEQTKDISLDQYLNYRLLGIRLCECQLPSSSADAVLKNIMQVISQYHHLHEYLSIADAYLDIILYHTLDDCLSTMLNGILERAQVKGIDEIDLECLQSILLRLVDYFNDLQNAFAMGHFVEILDLLYGTSRIVISAHILIKATRNDRICDPTTIRFLFERCQILHDSIDSSSMKYDYKEKADIISGLLFKVDFGSERERCLTFLAECRAAFGRIDELKDTLVHLVNNLAVSSMKDTNKFPSFLKSCMAFNEITIPSVSNSLRRLNLYIETAEVALHGGLVIHAEGLLNYAISCFECLDMATGSRSSTGDEQVPSLVCNLCSLLVMIPSQPRACEEGVEYQGRKLLLLLSYPSLTSSTIKMRILCAIIQLTTSLSQHKLPYHAQSTTVAGNDRLYYGELSYLQELTSVSNLALQNLDDVIEQEPHLATRGKLALEACNCILLSFKVNDRLSLRCSRFMDIAKTCLHLDDKYLLSLINFLDKKLTKM